MINNGTCSPAAFNVIIAVICWKENDSLVIALLFSVIALYNRFPDNIVSSALKISSGVESITSYDIFIKNWINSSLYPAIYRFLSISIADFIENPFFIQKSFTQLLLGSLGLWSISSIKFKHPIESNCFLAHMFLDIFNDNAASRTSKVRTQLFANEWSLINSINLFSSSIHKYGSFPPLLLISQNKPSAVLRRHVEMLWLCLTNGKLFKISL